LLLQEKKVWLAIRSLYYSSFAFSLVQMTSTDERKDKAGQFTDADRQLLQTVAKQNAKIQAQLATLILAGGHGKGSGETLLRANGFSLSVLSETILEIRKRGAVARLVKLKDGDTARIRSDDGGITYEHEDLVESDL
jgi:hypothetical protein